ncbi:hypothetical protein PR003_g12555 [Phytophthora rubi]|uniref:Uncharacterized protein n=1 Tax=Phytophthora rubi TaxID=129364 RepID=A0A6A3LQ63_9STRA|nr:hypothetical protein PR002_g12167 [Phytophthora rubi]KAE9028094.1 hypothetical protein PR001_g11810 [Phytophthora rubi]KAE9336342.1 hypothetical protein PR003_g12555 [Phytophthora rubi]
MCKQERIREKLDLKVEENRDFVETAEATAESRKREEQLRQAGLRHRENVAGSIIGDRVTELGGRQQRLSSEGIIEDAPDENAESGQGTRTQRQRRNPRHQQRIEAMLEDELTTTSDLEACRLALEEKRFAAYVELQRAQLELQREGLQLAREDRKQSLELELKKLIMKPDAFQAEMRVRAAERDQHREEFERSCELKFKKLELMLKSQQK